MIGGELRTSGSQWITPVPVHLHKPPELEWGRGLEVVDQELSQKLKLVRWRFLEEVWF